MKTTAPKAVVQTHVEKAVDRTQVTLTCSVEIQSAVTACKFRDHTGRVLLASNGIGEGRYQFYGNGEQ